MPTKTNTAADDTAAKIADLTEEANSAADEHAAKVADLTDEANKKVAEYIEQVVASQKKLAHAAIDSYEDTVLRIVDSYEKAVAESKIDWLQDAVAPQTKATRELTTAYVKAARELVN
jgi:hypothetical protein